MGRASRPASFFTARAYFKRGGAGRTSPARSALLGSLAAPRKSSGSRGGPGHHCVEQLQGGKAYLDRARLTLPDSAPPWGGRRPLPGPFGSQLAVALAVACPATPCGQNYFTPTPDSPFQAGGSRFTPTPGPGDKNWKKFQVPEKFFGSCGGTSPVPAGPKRRPGPAWPSRPPCVWVLKVCPRSRRCTRSTLEKCPARAFV